jgi:zinc protease
MSSGSNLVKKSFGTVALTLALFFTACSSAIAPQAIDLSGKLPTPEHYRLDNGLDVVLYENHSAPVVSVQIWVDGGAADETLDIWGIFHLYEHMSFKGTKRFGVGEIARAVSSAGGDINAYTSYDHTVYHVTMPAEGFERGLDVISDAVLNSVFDAEELRKEKEVVIEEIRRSLDNPRRLASYSLFEQVFNVHPYGRRILGTEQSVLALDRDRILEVYHNYYVPSNMTLVIAGDFDPQTARARIDEIFATRDGGEKAERPRPAEPEQKGLRVEVLPADSERAYLQLGFPTQGLTGPDVPALDLLAMAASDGRNSPLYRALRLQTRLVDSVYAASYTPSDEGMFFISEVLEPANVIEALKKTLQVIYGLRDNAPPAENIDAARLAVSADFIYSLEDISGLAREFGYYYTHLGGLDFRRTYLTRINEVTESEIIEVAGKYLVPEKLNVSLVIPRAMQDKITVAMIREAAEDVAREYRAQAAGGWSVVQQTLDESGPKPIERFEFANGARLILRRNSDIPTVAYRFFLGGGIADESREQQGVAGLAADLLTRGAGRYDADEFSRQVDAIAGRAVGADADANYFYISGNFLSQYAEKGLQLLAAMIDSPRFEAREFERLVADRLAALERRKDNPASVAFRQFRETMYPEHSYGHDPLGTPEVLNRLKPTDVAEFWGRHATTDRLVISVSGDIDSGRLIEILRRNLAGIAETGEAESAAREMVPVQKMQLAETFDTVEQAHLVYGFRGTTYYDDDRFVLTVGTQVLADMGGRLFVKLRDQQSLAYSVTAFSSVKTDPGFVAAYIATAPGKLQQAIDGIKRELKLLVDEPVSESELQTACASIIGYYQMSLATNEDWAFRLGIYETLGLGYNYYRTFPEKVRAVSAADIMRVAKKYFDFEHPVISVVRPEGVPPKMGY